MSTDDDDRSAITHNAEDSGPLGVTGLNCLAAQLPVGTSYEGPTMNKSVADSPETFW